MLLELCDLWLFALQGTVPYSALCSIPAGIQVLTNNLWTDAVVAED